VVNNKITGS